MAFPHSYYILINFVITSKEYIKEIIGYNQTTRMHMLVYWLGHF